MPAVLPVIGLIAGATSVWQVALTIGVSVYGTAHQIEKVSHELN